MKKMYVKLWDQEFFWISFSSLILLIETVVMTALLIFNESLFMLIMKIAVLLEPLNFGVSGVPQNINLSSHLLNAVNHGYKPLVLMLLIATILGSLIGVLFPLMKIGLRKAPN